MRLVIGWIFWVACCLCSFASSTKKTLHYAGETLRYAEETLGKGEG
ncbi:MAG: hypothetical protein NW226_06610 [Microscillaceae bacterium]|nr:hypothetical protein [Microscillaceae bacterium]